MVQQRRFLHVKHFPGIVGHGLGVLSRFIKDKLHLKGAGRFRLLGPTGGAKDARLLRLGCSDSVLQFPFASPERPHFRSEP